MTEDEFIYLLTNDIEVEDGKMGYSELIIRLLKGEVVPKNKLIDSHMGMLKSGIARGKIICDNDNLSASNNLLHTFGKLAAPLLKD